jgi:hypothetical protein
VEIKVVNIIIWKKIKSHIYNQTINTILNLLISIISTKLADKINRIQREICDRIGSETKTFKKEVTETKKA